MMKPMSRKRRLRFGVLGFTVATLLASSRTVVAAEAENRPAGKAEIVCKPRQEYSQGSYLVQRKVVKQAGKTCAGADGLALKEVTKGEIYNSQGKWDTGLIRLMTKNWCQWASVLRVKGEDVISTVITFTPDGEGGVGREVLKLPGCRWDYEIVVFHLPDLPTEK
jgi:hypothetical protein